MSKHTEGPWSPCFITMDRKVIGFHISGHPYGSTRPICETSKDCAPEMEANGRLIAAAPELFAACDPEILEAIADEIDCFEHSARASGLRLVAKRQRAAVAKAKGTKP